MERRNKQIFDEEVGSRAIRATEEVLGKMWRPKKGLFEIITPEGARLVDKEEIYRRFSMPVVNLSGERNESERARFEKINMRHGEFNNWLSERLGNYIGLGKPAAAITASQRPQKKAAA